MRSPNGCGWSWPAVDTGRSRRHWVEAVVEEIQMGHHYRVSGT
jgi:hypothetical protein